MDPKTVLIVDDEPDVRIFLSTLFETSGYRPLTAENGEEGFRIAGERRPDLIILDIMMPGEGGVAMYRNLRTDKSLMDTPVIVLSAISRRTFNHYLKMVNAGLDREIGPPEGYMEKPPEAADLLEMAEAFL